MLRSLVGSEMCIRDIARLEQGTTRRVLGYARPFVRSIVAFLTIVILDAGIVVAVPLLLRDLVDLGVIPKAPDVVVRLALLVAALAVADAILSIAQRWFSSRIGEGLILRLRTEVFAHVLRQPIAFFTRAQTGSLVSRLNSDVIGAQQAFTSVLSSVVSNAVSLVLIVAAMATLSWQLTLAALALVPFFLIPARFMGRRLSELTRTAMTANADLGTLLEYNWDSRGKEALTNFQNDAFIGGRLAFNDVQSTSLLGGVFVDLDSAALAFGLEGERRLGEDWKLSVEMRIFSNIPADDLLTFVRKDDYIQATLTWYF